MGVVNVTPDSFSDGGVNLDPADAIAAARRMVDEGAAIVDVGGESTRPGSEGVSAEEELRRVVPVLEAVAGELPVSVDTSKAEVARQALAAGAELVNDVTALRSDPDLAGVAADAGCYLCLMHMLGEPRTMQDDPRYDDVASEVAAFLEERLAFAVSQGVAEELICLDPGIGFGKTTAHNVELVRRLDVLLALGRPIVIGFSRKRSLGRLAGDPDATTGPLGASLAAAVAAYERGATILRVHDVRETVDALAVAKALLGVTTIELAGIELHGYHGVNEDERRDGQRFLFDVWLEVPDGTGASDELEDTIDYREVAALVREVSDGRAYRLLEALSAALVDALLARFPVVDAARVRVRKPEVRLDPPVEHSAVTVERRRR